MEQAAHDQAHEEYDTRGRRDSIDSDDVLDKGTAQLATVESASSGLRVVLSTNSAETKSKLVAAIIQAWNGMDWLQTRYLLDALETGLAASHTETTLKTAAVRHLRAISATFAGDHKLARQLFETLLEQLNADTEDIYPTSLEHSALQWLAHTCILLREWDDAALAFAIVCRNINGRLDSLLEDETRALTMLSLMETGNITGQRQWLSSYAQALSEPDGPTKVSILPSMPRTNKAHIVSAVLPHCQQKPSTSTAPPTASLSLDESAFVDPFRAGAAWPLRNDYWLLPDGRKFAYVNDYGLPIADNFLTMRFLGKTHFPQINLTALYTTRRGLPWLLTTLERELCARGMLCKGFWDRMRVVRVRDLGDESDQMGYVAAFVIVFHKWPVGSRIGCQIPAHLIRDDWSTVRKPGVHLYPRLVRDIKSILETAEAREGGEAVDADDSSTMLQRRGSGQDLTSTTSRTQSVAESRRGLLSRLRSTNHSSRAASIDTTFDDDGSHRQLSQTSTIGRRSVAEVS